MGTHLLRGAEMERAGDRCVRTPWVQTDFPGRRLVVSWAGPRAPTTTLRVEVQVRVQGETSPWFLVGGRGPGLGSAEALPPGLRLEADEVVATGAPLEAARMRLTWDGEGGVERASLCFWPSFDPVRIPTRSVAPRMETGRIPQHQVHPELGSHICGPTSLTMALRHFGLERSVLEVVEAVRDPWTGIHGHWTYLAAYAGECGLDAWVERGGGPARLVQQLQDGALVILSLRWEPGELVGAPNSSSQGHLVLAVGGDRQGCWVMDPAFRDPEKQLHRYDWQSLIRSWKSGASVVLKPPRESSP